MPARTSGAQATAKPVLEDGRVVAYGLDGAKQWIPKALFLDGVRVDGDRLMVAAFGLGGG